MAASSLLTHLRREPQPRERGRSRTITERALHLALFTTTDAASGRAEELTRMVEHVGRARAGGLDVDLHLLVQRAPLPVRLPDWVDVHATADRLSLSRARNVLLDRVLPGLADDDVIGFPDDDAWHPPGVLQLIAHAFGENPGLDLWFCRYSSHPAPLELAGQVRAARWPDVVRRASSNTTYVRVRCARAVGTFDEALGVGTPSGGAEDTDYAIRARSAAEHAAYLDAAVVGHRDPVREMRVRYYGSSLGVLRRHAANPSLRVELLRKYLVGAAYLLQRQLSPSELRRAFVTSRSLARSIAPDAPS